MKCSHILFFGLLTVHALHAHAQTTGVCLTAYEKAEQEKISSASSAMDRTVSGAERLYFHIAPDGRCRLKNVFVIPNDHLEVYAYHGEFSEVIYWNPATGAGTAGWVLSSRLVETTRVLDMVGMSRHF